MDFVGRKKEINQINKSYNSNRNEFVAIYGRRRIGKTYLVKNTLENEFDFYYTGIYKISKKDQLKTFYSCLQKYGYKGNTPFKDWFEAFDGLKEAMLTLNKNKVCIFIDELPWLDSKNSNFVQAFANFWNTWDSLNGNHTLLKLYVCGSATTWIIKKIIKDKGGLHNRLTDSIHLKQFSLSECNDYFSEITKTPLSKLEILDVYMCTGGIPYYLSKFNKKIPISTQIDELFFSDNASMRDEFDYLYDSLFNDSKNYKKIINALCANYKGITRDDLIASTKIEGGSLTECLENLENCGFIRKFKSFNNTKKESLYQIIDLCTIFYLKFVKDASYDSNHWTNMIQTPSVNSWKGFAFERVLLLHIDELKKALGISGISSNVYSYTKKSTNSDSKGLQIDLLIDRNDNVINICEIKYSTKEYKITKDYNDYVNERINAFKKYVGTKKALKNTFITTFGLDENSLMMVDANLSLEDLF